MGNYLAIFGGRRIPKDGEGQIFDDGVYLLSLDSLMWTRLRALDALLKQPQPRMLFRSEFMTAVVESRLAPVSQAYRTRQETDDYSQYRHSQKILIFGGIDERFTLSNRIMQLEFFQNKMLSNFQATMRALVAQ